MKQLQKNARIMQRTTNFTYIHLLHVYMYIFFLNRLKVFGTSWPFTPKYFNVYFLRIGLFA